jgi:hypothetical protein
MGANITYTGSPGGNTDHNAWTTTMFIILFICAAALAISAALCLRHYLNRWDRVRDLEIAYDELLLRDGPGLGYGEQAASSIPTVAPNGVIAVVDAWMLPPISPPSAPDIPAMQ